jgi:hypothetical protein
MRTVASIPLQRSAAIGKEASSDAFFCGEMGRRRVFVDAERRDALRAERGRADDADAEALVMLSC